MTVNSNFTSTGLNSPITEFALALAICKELDWRGFGTAILIGPHIALTAKHVFENAWRTFEKRRLLPQDDFLIRGTDRIFEHQELTGSFPMIAHQVLENGKSARIWTITKLWTSPHTDIAVLRLTPWLGDYSGQLWRGFPELDISPPSPGEKLSAFGYHSSQITVQENGNKIEVVWQDDPTTTLGLITGTFNSPAELASIGRTFPCFQTDMQVADGMSGGPVLNSEGMVCGIVSYTRQFQHLDTEGLHESFCATLWPVLGTPIPGSEFASAECPDVKLETVHDLARLGIIKAPQWHKFRWVEGSRKVAFKVD